MSADGLGRAEQRRGELSEFVRRALIAIGPDRRRVVTVAALGLLIGLLEATLLYLTAFIAVAVANGRETLELSGPGPLPELSTSLGTAVLLAGGFLLAASLIQVPLSRGMAALSARAVKRMRTAILGSYLTASTKYRSTHKEGYLVQLVGEYSNRSEAAVQQLTLFTVSLCTLSMFIAAAIAATPVLASGAIVVMFATALVLRPFASKARQNATEQASSTREVVRRIAQVTRLSEEITAFDVGRPVADEISPYIRRSSEFLQRLRFEARLVPALSQYSLLGMVLLMIGILSVTAPSALRDIAPLILLLVRATAYVRQLTMSSRAGIQLIPYLDLMQAEMSALESNQAEQGEEALPGFDGLDLRGVGFEYTPGQPVLADVDLSIRPGEMLGLIGPSGSGKSTLSQLLVGLRRPTSGSVTTGGVELEDVSPQRWSRVSACVPQDPKLALATVADNIRFFREGHDLAAVEHAARAAHVHDELLALPQGYETLIGPGARQLSGGQRQRLAIARALLEGPQLIILDEPTSALDARSEELISKTLQELKGTATIVLIAHRPAPLAVCDRVFRVRAGSVDEGDPVSAQTP